MNHRLVLVASVLFVAACSNSGNTNVQMSRSERASLFTVPESQLGHLKVVTVKKSPVRRPLVVPAVVRFDDLKTSEVMPLVSGKVSKVLVREGDKVKVGEPMLAIASPDSSDAAAALTRDQAALKVAETILKRDKDLYAHKAISLEAFQQAQLAVESAQATVSTDQRRVRITGTGTGHAWLRAPIAGVVVSRKIAVGDAVQAGSTPCFTVTDPKAVWIMGQLYQEDLRRVSVGDVAVIHSPVLDGPLTGKVTYVGASIDPDTLTVPVRISADNPGGLLKAGEYVDAAIEPARPEEALLVPEASVLRDEDNLPFVYVQAGAPGTFARRHVTLGDEVGGKEIVLKGLEPGEKVLGDGALFVQFADSLER